MQIVIKIPEDEYNKICSGNFEVDGYFKMNLKEAFRNAIPIKALEQVEMLDKIKDEREKIAEDVANKMDYISSCLNEKNIILGVITGKRETTDSLCSICKSEGCVSNGTAISKADYEARLKTNIVAILNKIRAEIEQNAYPIVHGVNSHEKGMTLYGILQVIDKYKTESEGIRNDCKRTEDWIPVSKKLPEEDERIGIHERILW